MAFAASVDESQPVLTGVLLQIDRKTIAMAATDGFRLALHKTEVAIPLEKKQLIIPASVLKEVLRILSATKASTITLYLPSAGSQVVLRLENVQIVSQQIDGKFPDFQVIIPKDYKTSHDRRRGRAAKRLQGSRDYRQRREQRDSLPPATGRGS